MSFWHNIEISHVFRIRTLLALSVLCFTVQFLTLSAPTVIGEPYYIAKNVVNGHGYSSLYPFAAVSSVHSYIAPLYVILLSIIFLGGGDIVASQILNLIFLQIAFIIIFFFLQKIMPLRAAGLGFIALQCYVPLWLLAECVDPNALNILLMAATISILYALSGHSTLQRWLGLGIVTGLQLLVRPDMIIGIVFFLPWIIIHIRKEPNGKYLKGLTFSALLAIALVLPWTIRNAMVFHSFIPLSANGGYNLYMGNNPAATGELWQTPKTPEMNDEEIRIKQYSQSHTQPELDAMLFHLAIQWIAAHPQEAIILALKKIFYHWFGREHGAARPGFRKYRDLYSYFNIIIVLSGIIGLFLLKETKARSLLGIVFIYSTVVSAVFFVQSRHKMIKVDPFLIPLAAYSVYFSTKKLGHKLLPKENV